MLLLLCLGGIFPSLTAQWSITARAGFDFADQKAEKFIDPKSKTIRNNIEDGVLRGFGIGLSYDVSDKIFVSLNGSFVRNIFLGTPTVFAASGINPNIYERSFIYFVDETGEMSKNCIDLEIGFKVLKSMRLGFNAGINQNSFHRIVEYTARPSDGTPQDILERVGFEKQYASIWVPRVGASVGYDFPIMGRLSVAPEVQFFYDFMPDRLSPGGIDPAPEHIASLPGFQEVANSGVVTSYEKKFFFFNVVLRYSL